MSRCPECNSKHEPCLCGVCAGCEEKDIIINQLEGDLKKAVEILDSIKVQSIVNGLDNQNKVAKRINDFKENMASV